MNSTCITYKKNKGFTLVELIVALTILAMIAAIILPALLGYIDRARANKDIIDARNCMQAVQAELMEMYAFDRSGQRASTGEGDKSSVFPKYQGVNANKNADIDMTQVPKGAVNYAKKIFKTADNTPYLLIVGVGSWGTYEGTTDARKAYTCYICMYMKDKDSQPVFFDGEQWTTEYPGKENNGDRHEVYKSSGNIIKSGRKYAGTKIQYYMFASAGGRKVTSNDVWSYLRGRVKAFQ